MTNLDMANENIEHIMCWHPCTEKPVNLKVPILFLTNRGAIVTHKTLWSKTHNCSLFNSRASYANAVAWAYQDDLIPRQLIK